MNYAKIEPRERKGGAKMSLQFILGRANTDKRSVMLDEISDLLTENRDTKVFYLVPEHIKFDAEMTVLNELGNMEPFNQQEILGMMQVQVFSFSRLAWYLLQDTDLYVKPQLTQTGLSMLIRKLLLEYEDELTIYRGEVRKNGFVQKLSDLFFELRSGRISQDDLVQMIQQLGETPKEADFKLKLQDIALIYRAFDEAVKGKYIETEDVLTTLIEKIQTSDLSDTYIYLEGFYQFTAQEQELILALMQHTKKVTLSLTLDKAYGTEKPELLSLFRVTGTTYYKLYQTARQNQVKIQLDKVITEKDSHYCEELNQLETYWVDSNELSPVNLSLQENFIQMDDCIEIWGAENKQAEVDHVATEIKKLVASGRYRYKDILVLARNPEDYRTLLEPTFDKHHIETFFDSAEVMSHHPLSELLDALFAIKKNGWRYADVMRFLRTELFLPAAEFELSADREVRVKQYIKQAAKFREAVDVTENVVLAYGYEGYQWTRKEPWKYTRFQYDEDNFQSDTDVMIEKTANTVKEFLNGTLTPFFKRLDKAKTSMDAAKLVYQFLEAHGVPDQLLFWRDELIQENDLEGARRHEQVWQVFIQLLDEYVEVLGDQSFEEESFRDILTTGFENASYSMVPPTIDQVIFSGLAGARIGTAKVTFILGLTNTNLPIKAENKTMLTEEDRSLIDILLASEEKYLKPSVESQMAAEPFIAYQAFLDSSEKLYLIYPTSNDSKDTPKLSPYVQRIAQYFKIPIQEKLADVISLAEVTKAKVLSFVGSKEATMGQLLMVLRKTQDQQGNLHPFWQLLYRYFKTNSDTAASFSNLLNSLRRKNIPLPLTEDLAEKLYGKDLYLSVSQLESYYADPFTHFLTYGLKLRERDVFELSPAGTGEYFHEALDLLFKTLVNRDLSFQQLDPQAIEQITNEVLESLVNKGKYQILSASNRMQYIREQLGKTIQSVALAIGQQSRRTNMRNAQTEVLFGQIASQKGIEGRTYDLENNRKLHLRGKIDRVDAMEINQKPYLAVVDYKSSQHKFDFKQAYYGLAMQMLTYLDIALSHADELLGKKAYPAGAFYLHIQNPFLKEDKLADDEKYLQERLKLYKMDGILLNELDLLDTIDLSVESSTSSLVYPFGLKANGEPKKNEKLVTLDEIETLLKYNQQKIIHAGNNILKGDTRLSPIKERSPFISSVSGPLKAVSFFDAALYTENKYRRMEDLSKEEILERMKREGGAGE